MYYLRIRSRNSSAAQLRKKVKSPVPSVLRLGSKTQTQDIFSEHLLRKGILEINKVEACTISGDKILMKRAFQDAGVPTAVWNTLLELSSYFQTDSNETPSNFPLVFPIIIKHKHSSRGNGIYFMEDFAELKDFFANCPHPENFIIEHYYNYVREYRLHIDKFGCFLAHRKMLRSDASVRWHRHHSNSTWISEDNPLFCKPDNWNAIVEAAQKARIACKLDICSVDVKVQSSRTNPDFIILETNSASAMNENTANIYIEELKRLIEYMTQNLTPIEENPSSELSEEEQLVARQVSAMQDTPISVVVPESTSSDVVSYCPKKAICGRNSCKHLIIKGINYGNCDQTHETCPFLMMGTNLINNFSIADSDDEDDEDIVDYWNVFEN